MEGGGGGGVGGGGYLECAVGERSSVSSFFPFPCLHKLLVDILLRTTQPRELHAVKGEEGGQYLVCFGSEHVLVLLFYLMNESFVTELTYGRVFT